MPLHLVNPQPKPRETATAKAAKRIKAQAPAELLECPRCKGHEVIETKIGMLYVNGRAKGGTKQFLCAGCLMRGERVVLT